MARWAEEGASAVASSTSKTRCTARTLVQTELWRRGICDHVPKRAFARWKCAKYFCTTFWMHFSSLFSSVLHERGRTISHGAKETRER
jgi:hypothetical protein